MEGADQKSWRFGRFRLDPARRRLECDGEQVDLRGKAFDALVLLVANRGRPVSRAELMDALWPEMAVEEANLTQAISVARRALGDQEKPRRYIETISGVGYQFVAPAEDTESSDARPASFVAQIAAGAALAAAVGTLAIVMKGRLTKSPSQQLTLIPITQDPGLTADPAVSRDEKWLAYTSDRDGGGDLDIWVQPFPISTGDAPRQVTNHPGHEIRPDLAPDGSAVVYTQAAGSLSEVILHYLDDGAEKRIGLGDHARFSPDGRFLSFVETGLGKLYVHSLDTGKTTQVRPDFAILRSHDWLPDSSRIVAIGKKTEGTPATFWFLSLGDGEAVDSGFKEDVSLPTTAFGLRWLPQSHEAIFNYAPTDDLRRVGFTSGSLSFNGVFEKIPAPVPMAAQYPSVTAAGLVFGARTLNEDVRSLSLNAGAGDDQLERVTDDTKRIRFGGVSRDVRKLLYRAYDEDGALRPWVRDLSTGVETLVCRGVESGRGPQISPDGKKVACAGIANPKNALFDVRPLWVQSLEDDSMRLLCEECGYPSSWSPDGEAILAVLLHRPKSLYRVSRVSVETGEERILLEDERLRFGYPFLSPDSRWIYFLAWEAQPKPGAKPEGALYAAPMRLDTPIPQGQWTRIVDLPAEAPAISADGRTIYFLSRRDGDECIWGQRVFDETAQPYGMPFAVHHSHNFRSSIGLGRSFDVQMNLAGDRLYFPWGISSGNVWMYEGFE